MDEKEGKKIRRRRTRVRGEGGAGKSESKKMNKNSKFGLLLAPHVSDLDSPGHLDSALFLLSSASFLHSSTLASLPFLLSYSSPLHRPVFLSLSLSLHDLSCLLISSSASTYSRPLQLISFPVCIPLPPVFPSSSSSSSTFCNYDTVP